MIVSMQRFVPLGLLATRIVNRGLENNWDSDCIQVNTGRIIFAIRLRGLQVTVQGLKVLLSVLLFLGLWISADHRDQQHKFYHTKSKVALVVPLSSKCFKLSSKPHLGYAWYGHAQFRGGRSSREGGLNWHCSLIFLIWQGKDRNPRSHISWDLLQVGYKDLMKKVGMLFDFAILTFTISSPSCLLSQFTPLFLPS